MVSLHHTLLRAGLLLAIPVLSPIYQKLNCSNGNPHVLTTGIDKSIPFVPVFIIPYFTWYGYIFIAQLWLLSSNGDVYMRSVTATILGLVSSYVIYSAYQTKVPRPLISGKDLFSNLTKFLYSFDNPYNCFPSIHVMTSSIIFMASRETVNNRGISLLTQGTAAAIIASTLFLKQHVILDVAGGMLIAKFSWAQAGRLLNFLTKVKHSCKQLQTIVNFV